MKNFRFHISIFLVLFFCISCNLNRYPETDLSDISFWRTDDNFKQACNLFYTLVDGEYDIWMDDVRSDFAFNNSRGANEISSGTRLASATSKDWDNAYIMIFNANNILEKAEGSNEAKNINQWKAEAKFWRAYAYFRLVTRFGDVPLVLKTLDINSPELDGPRVERVKVVQQIFEDLDFAAQNLPGFKTLGAADYGRASKSAALAFKARVALYEGTRQKFHNYGTSSANLSAAIAASNAAMEEGHKLYTATATPYFNQFQYVGEGFGNSENILSTIYGVGESQIIRSHDISSLISNGFYCVTRPMVQLYLCTDGLPLDKSPLAENPELSYYSMFKNKDPRMAASIVKPGDDFNIPDIFPEVPVARIGTGYCPKKYYIPRDPGWSKNRSYIDVSIIRYAEVLLVYAEAKFELDGAISDDDLNKSINLLRDRAGMPHLTNQFVTSNGLDMRTEIRRERSVELAQEGFRYDDINRWKIAEEVLSKPMLGAQYFPGFGGGWNVSDDGFLVVQKANTRFFNPAKDYLYPVPTKEIALSDGKITQNPGW
jgi:hypothetical protein